MPVAVSRILVSRTLVSLALTQVLIGEAGSQTPPEPAAAKAPAQLPVRIRSGVATPNGDVKPLALFDFELVSAADSTVRVAIQTDLDGQAEVRVAPGDYVLRSLKPTMAPGRSMRWDLPVRIAGRQPVVVQVTSANGISRGARPEKAFASPIELYNAVQHSIVRVQAGLGHGTGFMLEGVPGVAVTNDHVVGTASEVIVQVDSLTSVFATVLLRDTDADIALLRFNESVCNECPGLRLSSAPSADKVVAPGDQLVAIGYPLSQKLSITAGIASSVRDGAIISDVNVNPGNSGGPLLNMYGDVVGVNTFAESGKIGAGIAGSIVATRLVAILDSAKVLMPRSAMPSAERLPVLPRARFSMSALRAVAETASVKRYERYAGIEAQNFLLTVSTPQAFMVNARSAEMQVAASRREREQRAGLSSGESYSELRDLREWRDYVGDETSPVVAVRVEPTTGLEGEGALGKAGAIAGRFIKRKAGRKEFKGDVRGVSFTRNGRLVRAVSGGHAPVKVQDKGTVTETVDVADFGFYTLLPDVFEPDSTGKPPVIEVEIADLKNPNLPRRAAIPPDVVASVWNDFVPYLRAQSPVRKIEFAKVPGEETKKDDKKKEEKKDEKKKG